LYSHCIFCQGDLKQNQEIEHFQIGRRLAYDLQKGRLWAVCSRCHRWNLSPIEERWEALEDCERAFHASRVGAASENISVARTPGKMDLIRIGEPLRREMAFWRWGDRFGRRRRKAMIVGGGILLAGTIGTVGTFATGAAAFAILGSAAQLASISWTKKGSWKVKRENGKLLEMRGAGGARVAGLDEEGRPRILLYNRNSMKWEPLSGERALRAAALLIPSANQGDASDTHVNRAISAIEEAGGRESFIEKIWTDEQLREKARPRLRKNLAGSLAFLPVEVRVGLEMALHEEEERKALAGELAELEAMWVEAEKIAAISDSLLVPESWGEISGKKK